MLKGIASSSAYEKVFIKDALINAGIRLDGREIEDFRNLSIHLTRTETSSRSELTLGKTSVIAIVTGRIETPYPDKPNEGFLRFNTDITSIVCDAGVSHFEISRALERIIRDSKSIDLESLCIVSGEKVWEIVCEVKVIDSSGGNILDASILTAMGALKAFRKPDISIIETALVDNIHTKSLIQIHHSDEREPLPLSLVHVPLSVTLGLLRKNNLSGGPNVSSASGVSSTGGIDFSSSDDNFIFLVDPSAEEEKVLHGKLNFSLNAHKQLCAMNKPGGVALPVQSILRATRLCLKKVSQLHQSLTVALNELETKELLDREARRETARLLRLTESKQLRNKDTSSEMAIDEVALKVGGIDRNDPILDWGNLHNPVSLRES